jgi:hypothetical protein
MPSFLQKFLGQVSAREKRRPIFIMMTIFGGLVVLTEGSAVAPLMCTIF